ncbi:MAG: Type 3 secretion system secretin [Chlamydiia bacterium]|nr:Type 3 secretion system secretin [Chlamydiia bacterium]
MIGKWTSIFFISTWVLFGLPVSAALTLEEKLSQLVGEGIDESDSLKEYTQAFNSELMKVRRELAAKYQTIDEIPLAESDEDEYRELLTEINDLKAELASLESRWHEQAVKEGKSQDEGYALWEHDEITLSQLVMEYGGADYLYVIPPEIASMKLQLHSSLPIPRESWNSLIELILMQNGIGYKQMNSYLRQLYLLKSDLLSVSSIVSQERDLDRLPPHTRLIYVFSPNVEHIKPAFYFFERFRDPKRSFIYQVGQKIAICGEKEEVKKLLILHNNVWEDENEKVAKVLSLTRMNYDEAKNLLSCFFGQLADCNRSYMPKGGCELSILPLAQENVIILVGPSETVSRAEEKLRETEGQVEPPSETVVYWYQVRNSDPVELAEVLERVYESLVHSNLDGENRKALESGDPVPPSPDIEINQNINPESDLPPADMYPYQGHKVVEPCSAQLGKIQAAQKDPKSKHFIPYPKTGQLLMVVRKDTVDKLKDILKRLDLPKKMVEIEVLLCEKRIHNRNTFGLNVLKLGSNASGNHEMGIAFDGSTKGRMRGLFEFFVSRAKSKAFPAFDITYNFLMNQDDVRVNASPSITTVNQTPATISIVDEISINNGAAPMDSNKGIVFEKSYTRAQYGITLVLTPTIHEPELDSLHDDTMITLESNVTFDTIKSDVQDRPNVNRRHVENLVRIPNGQTVILGGLRRKVGNDITEKIPFLGELPGIGKFFGTSVMDDQLTEMFIFITPRVVQNPKEDLEKIRDEMLCARPGDLPDFLKCLSEARKKEHAKLFSQSIRLLFGKVENDNSYY